METLEIAVSPREATGKGGARKERRDGRVPGILYSKNENVVLSVDAGEFGRLLRRASAGNALLDVKVEGKPNPLKALIKEIQRDPVTDRPVHFDLVHIEMDQTVRVRVPLHFVGTPIGVKQGGRIEQLIREVDIECLASDIPGYIDVDISHLGGGDGIHVRELAREGFRFLTASELVVLRIVSKKADEMAEAAAEAAEAAAAAEAAPPVEDVEAEGEPSEESGPES